MQQQTGLLSIGALARATGVPVETLRTWERRYGFPTAARTDSGHRRYSVETVERLRLVTQLIGLGHRPSNILSADAATLARLLADTAPPESPNPVEPPQRVAVETRSGPADGSAPLEAWFERVEGFESRGFERELRKAHAELGSEAFLTQRVAPFLSELGARWARGELGVRHEHFASERLREFLSAQWRPLSDASTGANYVLATLPSEQHVLGLHLAALVVALSGGRVVFLGANAPASEIAGAVQHHAADAALLSSAAGSDRAQTLLDLGALRQALGEDVAVVIGGQGVQGLEVDPAVALTIHSLPQLQGWLADREAH